MQSNTPLGIDLFPAKKFGGKSVTLRHDETERNEPIRIIRCGPGQNSNDGGEQAKPQVEEIGRREYLLPVFVQILPPERKHERTVTFK